MGGNRTIITVYLSQGASDAYGRYVGQQAEMDRVLATIAVDPYPPGWEAAMQATPGLGGYIKRYQPPFEYVYQFDAPEEITVLIIRLVFPHTIMM